MSLMFVYYTSIKVEVYQKLASEFVAIEPPVWSSLIKIFGKRGYNVKILDAEAEFLTHRELQILLLKKIQYYPFI